MRSEKQIQASRANGALSRGPVTTLGKRNSARNNLRHGFSIPDSSLQENPPTAFRALRSEIIAAHQPYSSMEMHLVHTMAVARWRWFRVLDAQKAAAAKAITRDRNRPTDPLFGSPEYHALHRYEIAFNLQYTRALSGLLSLRRRRTAENGVAIRTQEAVESTPSTNRVASWSATVNTAKNSLPQPADSDTSPAFQIAGGGG